MKILKRSLVAAGDGGICTLGMKAVNSANDIVQTIKYLIEGTDYITGSVINVDGGRSIN